MSLKRWKYFHLFQGFASRAQDVPTGQKSPEIFPGFRPARAYGLKKFGHEALGQQRMQGFAAYQLRTAFLRTNQKTMVLL